MSIAIDRVTFGYAAHPAVRDISLSIPTGKLLALLGPSGCGKTTLLQLIGGYRTPTTGTIHFGSRDVTTLPPEARNAGMVFQNYALFPHLSARDNIAFGLDVRRVPRPERNERVQTMLHRVGLTPEEGERRPSQLSGGQQQRVALARALVIQPEVLLLDEPLANLDRHLRDQLRTELRALQQQSGVTTVFVTHDQEEALMVSDLVAVMFAGRILQVGSPSEVYRKPRTPFVARFVGAANLVPGQRLEMSAATVMIRPEHFRLGAAAASCRWRWSGTVRSVADAGAFVRMHVACMQGIQLEVRSSEHVATVGDELEVGLPEEHLWPIPDRDDFTPSGAAATTTS